MNTNITGIFKTYHGTDVYYLKGSLHRVDGPAAIDGNGKEGWVVYGNWLEDKEVIIAKNILSGKIPLQSLPLYLGHPILKYFAQYILEGKNA